LVYPSTLVDVSHKELVIPLVSLFFINNIMEQNLVGFPNLVFLHVGPYISYFCSSYGGIGSALIMWLPMSNPLANITTLPKLVLGVAQVEIVTYHREPLDEDDDSS
jgi:hypothetical protein